LLDEEEEEEKRRRKEKRKGNTAVLLETLIDFGTGNDNNDGIIQSTLTEENNRQRRTPSKFMQELGTWRSFSYSLRKEDREVFNELVKNASRYADAVENSGRGYATEAFLVSLILSQRRMIQWLSKQIEKLEREEAAHPPRD
jgi:hypothetical protein